MSPFSEDMTCQDSLDQLEAYVDDDLEREVRSALERHLEACASCRSEVALAREIRSELRRLPALDAPEALLDHVRAEAREGARAGRRWWTLPAAWRPLPVALAAAATLLAVFVVPRYFPPVSPEATEVAEVTEVASETPEFDEAEVARATEEVRVALAYVGQVSRRTGLIIRDDLLRDHVVRPTTESLSALKDLRQQRMGDSNET